MREILQSIQAVDHVHGAFVADLSGQLVAREMPPVFDNVMLKNVSRVAGQCIAGLRTKGALDELDLVFDNARLVVKNLGQVSLFTLCEPEINTSFLDLTASVAAERIREQFNQQPKAPAGPSQRERLEKVLKDELGTGASKALEILAAAGDSREELEQAIDEIERMVRLFINKNKAGSLAGRLRGMLAD